jgi:hypothetical protein
VDLPEEVAGHVAISEVVVHGWDIAAASRHGYACETGLIQAWVRGLGHAADLTVPWPAGAGGGVAVG